MAEEANVPVANSPENKPAISRQEGHVEADVKELAKEGANGAASNGDDAETTSPDVATDNATIENQSMLVFRICVSRSSIRSSANQNFRV